MIWQFLGNDSENNRKLIGNYSGILLKLFFFNEIVRELLGNCSETIMKLCGNSYDLFMK